MNRLYTKFICVLYLTLLFINGCIKSIDDEYISKIDMPDIKKRGKLVAITGYNSYSYFIYQGRMMGYEYELIKKYADENNLNLELKVVKDIPEMFEMLNRGEGDVIAFSMTVTENRKQKAVFTDHQFLVKQVLIQRNFNKNSSDTNFISDFNHLNNKKIYVRKGTAYINQLQKIKKEYNIKFNIVEDTTGAVTEDLIKMVAENQIDYAVADENIARLLKTKYTNLNTSIILSSPQKVAWAVRKNSTELLKSLNKWINKEKKKNIIMAYYNKYFSKRFAFNAKIRSDYFIKKKGIISEYDNIIKQSAKQINWDWRMLASLIYEESNFDTSATSMVGAVGLMQILPETAKTFGINNPQVPAQNLQAGIRYIKYLDKMLLKYISNNDERIKFILASYNLGPGHIIDAINLAFKYGKNSQVWENNVEELLVKKSSQIYYNDEVVTNGFCIGKTTVVFVKNILKRYHEYKKFVS